MASKRKKNKDNTLYMLLIVTCAVLMVALVGTVFKDYSRVVQNRKETTELENKYQELLEEETSLNSEVVKLQDPSYVARYAREKYLYSKDGETILRIIDAQKDKSSSSQEETTEN
jgi:cell division protein DivIC